MTVSLLPAYMLGRFISSVSVAGVTNNGDGSFTTSTTDVGDLKTGKALDGFMLNPSNEGEDITPIDIRQKNNVTVASDFRIEANEIRQVNYNSILFALWAGYDYVRFQRNFLTNLGGTPGTNTFVVIAHILDVNERAARGKTVVTMTCDSAGLPPYYGPLSGLPTGY